MRSYNSITLASCLFATSSAFSTNSSPLKSYAVFGVNRRDAVRLYAEESSEEKTEETTSDDIPAPPVDNGTDILNSPAFLKRKIDVLKSDIASVDEKIAEQNKVLEAGKEEWGSQLDSLQTEFQTFSARLSKASESGNEQCVVEIAEKLVDVLDNFDRAFGLVEAETDLDKEIEDAYRSTNKKLLDTLAELGVKQVETLGTEFDYELHSAVMMRPDEDYEEGIVCEEFAKGYMMESGRLIRAAMVTVAA
jgi:molecular chaperone GrpE